MKYISSYARSTCFLCFLITHVQEALAAQQAQSGDVAAERAALRRDLEQLLKERGTLDSLKRVVASALKTQQQVGGRMCGVRGQYHFAASMHQGPCAFDRSKTIYGCSL
jgi:hypothetical protein